MSDCPAKEQIRERSKLVTEVSVEALEKIIGDIHFELIKVTWRKPPGDNENFIGYISAFNKKYIYLDGPNSDVDRFALVDLTQESFLRRILTQIMCDKKIPKNELKNITVYSSNPDQVYEIIQA